MLNENHWKSIAPEDAAEQVQQRLVMELLGFNKVVAAFGRY
jgi:hypothetical protein